MKLTVFGEKKDVISFTASYHDFIDGKEDACGKWQEAFFVMLGWKNTLDKRFWECTINSTNKGEAFLHIVSPLEYEEWVENLLKNCGYKNIEKSISKALVIQDPYYDNDDLDDTVYYFIDE